LTAAFTADSEDGGGADGAAAGGGGGAVGGGAGSGGAGAGGYGVAREDAAGGESADGRLGISTATAVGQPSPEQKAATAFARAVVASPYKTSHRWVSSFGGVVE
jgi:hypothetical protein